MNKKGAPEALPLVRVIDSWWFLREGDSLFFGDAAPSK